MFDMKGDTRPEIFLDRVYHPTAQSSSTKGFINRYVNEEIPGNEFLHTGIQDDANPRKLLFHF